jgi:hypothetical protein
MPGIFSERANQVVTRTSVLLASDERSYGKSAQKAPVFDKCLAWGSNHANQIAKQSLGTDAPARSDAIRTGGFDPLTMIIRVAGYA